MIRSRPGTPQLMKKMNRATVIQILTKMSPISQTQICRVSSLSRATVSTIISELREEDLVVEVSKKMSKGGRRRVLLQLNAEAGYVIGVDLGGTKMAGALTDLSGKVVYETKELTNAGTGPQTVFNRLVSFTEKLVKEAKIDKLKIKGAGIGVPGVVIEDGIVQWAPALKWRNFPLAQKLKQAFDFPIAVENDVNLQALGEYWYGAGQGADVLVCLAIGTGLGAGIVLNGRVFTGANKAAGEVCNLVTDAAELGREYPGFGFLETKASGSAVARQYSVKNSNAPQNVDAEYVFKKARQGEETAKEVIADFTRYLAMAVVSIACVLDPELIVLGGGVANCADLFLPQLKSLSYPVLQVRPRLEISALGDKAGVMGAVALTLQGIDSVL
ncbi:MAG TPA: ROK family transcriptional regulator [Firmicutes bacterium]|nr:ROK family transcriptional regulator [Bacillota bacterium]